MPLTAGKYAVPIGSTVLITGVNGFIGSHIADQFLNLSFKVRGTTRDPEKNAWLSNLFATKYGTGMFEFITVPDMAAQDAYADAMRGVSVVIHTASIFTMDPNPHNVIPGTVSGTLNALEAAARESSVKRFVLTSSSGSALTPAPNTILEVTTETWNDKAVEMAYRDPPYPPEHGPVVYHASKTLAEKAAWKFIEEKKPGFTFNAVLPNINFGISLDTANQGHPTTSGLVAQIFNGNAHFLNFIPPQYYVDVQDTALLHVAAAIHPDVRSERIFAFSEPVNGRRILAVLRKLYPERSFPGDPNDGDDLSNIVPRKRAENLLRELGKDGWTSLEDSIKWNTQDLV
ncbi:aldehyde reductase [Nemania diffusa]|nr:aldehyde reductase [Nemania diffusa]